MKKILIALAAVLFPALASAQVPGVLGYQGRLLKADGTPESGVIAMTFNLYDVETQGSAAWTETLNVPVTDGFYSVYLGETRSLTDVFDGKDLWLELSVGDKAFAPRQKVASVPYALLALTARNLKGGTVDATSLSVNGQAVTNSSGKIDLGQVSGCANAGEFLKWNGTAWTCQVVNSTVTASAPLTGDGSAATPLALAKATGAAPGYLDPTDYALFNGKLAAVTTAGAPLSGDGTAASPLAVAKADGTTAGYLDPADFAAFSNKLDEIVCSDGSLNLTTTAAGVSIAASPDLLEVLYSSSCFPGAVLKYDTANGWECKQDTDTVYTAAPESGLEVAGTSLSLLTACKDKEILKVSVDPTTSKKSWICAADQTVGGPTGGVSFLVGLAGDIDVVSPDASLVVGTSANNVTLSVGSVAWSKLTNVPSGFADGVDNDTTYSVGTTLTGNGTSTPWNVKYGTVAGTAAEGNHAHASYLSTVSRDTTLSGNGTAASPLSVASVEWSKLQNVPAGFADGTDNDTTYTVGTTLSGNGTSTPWNVKYGAVAGTAAEGNHAHASYLSTVKHDATLSGDGAATSLSVASVDWSKLQSVPAGFADGTDNEGVTSLTAGTGLTGGTITGTGTIAVAFGSTHTTVAYGDHSHDTAYIQNSNSEQAAASFNVAGSGRVGTTMTVGGNATVAGRLGIGTSSPTHSLDVEGMARVNSGSGYDVWVQGGTPATESDERNLALLGVTTNDRLIVNYAGEYRGGTHIFDAHTLGRGRTPAWTVSQNGPNQLIAAGSDGNLSDEIDAGDILVITDAWTVYHVTSVTSALINVLEPTNAESGAACSVHGNAISAVGWDGAEKVTVNANGEVNFEKMVKANGGLTQNGTTLEDGVPGTVAVSPRYVMRVSLPWAKTNGLQQRVPANVMTSHCADLDGCRITVVHDANTGTTSNYPFPTTFNLKIDESGYWGTSGFLTGVVRPSFPLNATYGKDGDGANAYVLAYYGDCEMWDDNGEGATAPNLFWFGFKSGYNNANANQTCTLAIDD